MNEALLKCCHKIWRLGYKRERGLEYCAEHLGYRPEEDVYVEHFRHMFSHAFD